MRIEISSKNYKPKDTLKDLLEKKINKFDKYFKRSVGEGNIISFREQQIHHGNYAYFGQFESALRSYQRQHV